jgi:hypothetical protein
MLVSFYQKSEKENSEQIIWKYVPVQVFGNDSNKPKFDSEETKRRLNTDYASLLICCPKT